MNDALKTHKRKIIFGLIIACLFATFHLKKLGKNENEKKPNNELEKVESTPRNTSIIEYGTWNPEAYREILGTVQSDNEVEVRTEVSGKIGKIYVNVGDQVRAGQALAGYNLSGDATAINYQSAANNLAAAKLSAANSIKSAETAIESAKRELEKTRIQQAQNRGQSSSGLGVTAKNAETTFDGALNFLDRMLGATLEYRTQVVFGRNQIGATNSILKNGTRTQVENLVRELNVLKYQTVPGTKPAIEAFARKRLDFAESVKIALGSYDQLIVNTIISDVFSEANRSTVQQQVDAYAPAIDSQIAAINSAIEGSRTTNVGTDLTILSAQNRVKGAEEQLELTRSQAAAQVISAQNQVNLAAASQSDLTVRSPISGKLAAKSIKVGDLVTPGQAAFSVVNEQGSKKVIAFLTQTEWFKVQLSSVIQIEVEDQVYEVTEKFLSPKIDAQTQKVLAEFTLPAGATLVGNLAKVLIPLGSVGDSSLVNLVPFSAVSFEPDGPEVLIINEENKAERKKIVVGKVVVSNIEIVSGLDSGAKVVEFYKRILPGETIAIPKVEPLVEIENNDKSSQ